VYTPNVLPSYYRHSDWLGTSRLATTPSSPPTNHLYYDGAYAPFGESYAETGTTDRDFTGQNQDTVSGLYDFLYREYNPAHGRWMSPDPIGLAAADPLRPQTWNRYAYVENNPLLYIDPDGTTDMDFSFGSSHGGAGSLMGYMAASMSGGLFSGAYGWGGQTCYTDGAAGSCSMAQGMQTSGLAAECPDSNCVYNADGLFHFGDRVSEFLYSPGMLSGSAVAWCAGPLSDPFRACFHSVPDQVNEHRLVFAR
jgi:RHS repeat-associated protein